jgi:hypothetical protein
MVLTKQQQQRSSPYERSIRPHRPKVPQSRCLFKTQIAAKNLARSTSRSKQPARTIPISGEKVHACVRTCGTGEAAARDKACYGGGGGRGVRRRRNQTKRHGTGVWIQLLCVIFALRVFAYLLGSKFYAGRRADRLGERKEAHCE